MMPTPRFVSVLLGVALAACAEEREPIQRVQPNAIEKSRFNGTWYYGRTVTDMPASTGFTFVGNSSTVDKVVFDLQESMLYVRRATELIKAADTKGGANGAYQGEVVGAFRIQSHFDIRRSYNPTTGEELNVLEENSFDRPWYKRTHVRIDWSNNLVHNNDLDFEKQSIESVPYYVQEFDAHGRRHPDAPKFEPDGSYFDITSRIHARSGTTQLEGYGEVALCLLDELTECGPGEYAIRHSFWKLDAKRQYVGRPYKGAETELFGFFWADRLAYDKQDGVKQQYKERWMARHNLWLDWKDKDGKAIPEAKRTPRPIVYHVNGDFPQDLKPVAKAVAGQWNKVFKEVVAATGNPFAGDMFVLCENNPVKKGDPKPCGTEGNAPRIGDIRYSFMAYVPQYMTYGLLGLGPSNKDPDTGEILSGMAYVYHHNNTAAFRTQELVELLNGTRKSTDFIDGVDLTDWRQQVATGQGRFQKLGLDGATHMVEAIANSDAAQAWQGRQHKMTPQDQAAIAEVGLDQWLQPHWEEMWQAGIGRAPAVRGDARLAKIAGTALEKLLLSPEHKLMAGLRPDAPVDKKAIAAGSPAQPAWKANLKDRQRMREQLASGDDCKFLPEMADDALAGVAKELAGKDTKDVYKTIRDAIYSAVLAHEVGHSLGLMHNFGGSDDAVNYFDDYWKIRAAPENGDGGKVGPRLTDPITPRELDQKIYNYAYSSVMDYAGRYTIDGAGVGKYDRAAMLWGYADKVEVWKDAGSDAGVWRKWFNTNGEILDLLITGPTATHYTALWTKMKEKLYDAGNRELIDASKLVNPKTGKLDQMTAFLSDACKENPSAKDCKRATRVPYIYCSHGRSDLSDHCLTRDYGADSQERMEHFLQEWDTWYVTRAFPRGQIGASNQQYASRWYSRLYHRIKQWNDIYGLYNQLLPRFFDAADLHDFLLDTTGGWGGKTWAIQNAFNYLVQTLLMPDIGFSGLYTQTDRPDGSKLYQESPFGFGDFKLTVANARYYSTNWSGAGAGGAIECGFFFWECLQRIGFYVDKVMAMEAMSDAETHYVARANPIDVRDWQVGYYSTFSDSIRRIGAAIAAGDWSRVGPYLDPKTKQLAFPNYAGPLTEVHANAVNPAADFTIQLYFTLLGLARFQTTFDRQYVDEAQVFVIGSGKAPAVAPDKLVTFTDPWTGLRYGALDIAGRVGSGEAMVAQANLLRSRSAQCDPGATVDLPGQTTTTADDCGKGGKVDPGAAPALKSYLQLIKAVGEMTAVMEYGNPMNP
ncbi:MAG: hypothetical protein EXR79_10990 [Myxococcales bacterium]|nr:hypothetical protein [Myxococcales bacterium]